MSSRAPLRWIRRAVFALPLLAGCVEVSHPVFSRIQVEVITPSGEPVPGARVEMRGGLNYPDVRAVDYTDGAGIVVFRLPGATYDLTVYAPDANWSPQRTAPRDAGTVDGQSIVAQVILTPLNR